MNTRYQHLRFFLSLLLCIALMPLASLQAHDPSCQGFSCQEGEEVKFQWGEEDNQAFNVEIGGELLVDGDGNTVYFHFDDNGDPTTSAQDLFDEYAAELGVKITKVVYKSDENEPMTIHFQSIAGGQLNSGWLKTGGGSGNCFELAEGRGDSPNNKAISHITFCRSFPKCPDANPSWDGNYDIKADDHYLTFTLDFPNGFREIAVETSSSDNIALRSVEGIDEEIEEGDLETSAAQNDFEGQDSYQWIKYDGHDKIEQVKVTAVPLEQASSRFMFTISDPCVTLQIDPELRLATPEAYALEGSYPNPFREETTIRFKMPEAGQTQVAVYDLLGRRVKTLADGWREADAHEVRWDGTGASGEQLSGGVYMVRLQAGQMTKTHRVVLLR